MPNGGCTYNTSSTSAQPAAQIFKVRLRPRSKVRAWHRLGAFPFLPDAHNPAFLSRGIDEKAVHLRRIEEIGDGIHVEFAWEPAR